VPNRDFFTTTIQLFEGECNPSLVDVLVSTLRISYTILHALMPFSSLSHGRSFMTRGRSSYEIASSWYSPTTRSSTDGNEPRAALRARSRAIAFSLGFALIISDCLRGTRSFGTATTALCCLVSLLVLILGMNLNWTVEKSAAHIAQSFF
jgi:hypothetical protein